MLPDNTWIKMRIKLSSTSIHLEEYSEIAIVFVVILKRFSIGGYQILPLSDEHVTTSWIRLKKQ